jgi:hypothetical protein
MTAHTGPLSILMVSEIKIEVNTGSLQNKAKQELDYVWRKEDIVEHGR